MIAGGENTKTVMLEDIGTSCNAWSREVLLQVQQSRLLPSTHILYSNIPMSRFYLIFDIGFRFSVGFVWRIRNNLPLLSLSLMSVPCTSWTHILLYINNAIENGSIHG